MTLPKRITALWTTLYLPHGDISGMIKMNTLCQPGIEGKNADGRIQNTASYCILKSLSTPFLQQITSEWGLVYERTNHMTWLTSTGPLCMTCRWGSSTSANPNGRVSSILKVQVGIWTMTKQIFFEVIYCWWWDFFNYDICAKINNSFIGFSSNIHWPENSNGSGKIEEGSCEQGAPTQFDESDPLDHSICVYCREFVHFFTFRTLTLDLETRIALRGKGWTIDDGAFEYGVFYQNIVKMFESDPDDDWAKETLLWWNE